MALGVTEDQIFVQKIMMYKLSAQPIVKWLPDQLQRLATQLSIEVKVSSANADPVKIAKAYCRKRTTEPRK